MNFTGARVHRYMRKRRSQSRQGKMAGARGKGREIQSMKKGREVGGWGETGKGQAVQSD